MKHLALFLSDKHLRDQIRDSLVNDEQLNLIEVGNLEQIQQLIELGTKFDLLVIEQDTQSAHPQGVSTLTLERPTPGLGDIVDRIREALGEVTENSYTSMPLHLFNHFRQLPVDVFIRMNKAGKPHFVQRYFARDEISQEELDSFQARGITDLWVEKGSLKHFSKEVISALRGEIEKKSVAIADLGDNERVFNSLGEMIKKVGVKPAVVELCDSWMANLAKSSLTCMHSPVRDWFQRLSSDSTLDFQFKLVRLTTLICGQYVLSTDWVSKEEQASRLAGVALFADMSITNPSFIHYRSYEMAQELKGEDKLLVLSHAQRSSQIISHAQFVAKDVGLLVAQHHGSPDGEKIPLKISANVSPLAYVYMLAEEMGYCLLKDSNLPVGVVYEGLKKRFSGTPVASYVAALPNILVMN